ncbi:MAG: hypothetical protein GXO43_08380 [Crenarchaeota archaeon]|nr:hypothetical protein [Thermoproteota archaeon]
MTIRSFGVLVLIISLLSIMLITGLDVLHSALPVNHVNNTYKILADSGDPSCTNQGSSLCDSIVVSAQITGQSDLDSYGSGSATGDALLGGSCCVIDSYAEVQIGYYDTSLGIYRYVTPILWLDGSTVSYSFHPAGNIMYTSVVQNMCDNVEPSVAVSLDGTCFT